VVINFERKFVLDMPYWGPALTRIEDIGPQARLASPYTFVKTSEIF
jgi:hypothetical protein